MIALSSRNTSPFLLMARKAGFVSLAASPVRLTSGSLISTCGVVVLKVVVYTKNMRTIVKISTSETMVMTGETRRRR